MRILIAEDDQVLADGLLRSLRSAGYAIDQVGSGTEADAALADARVRLRHPGPWACRGCTAWTCCAACAPAVQSVPVLILTAADSVEQRVRGLDLGADDYMAKPFSLQELEARVRALTRRGLGTAATVSSMGR